MLVHVTGGKNEAIHFFIGNRQWGILALVIHLKMVEIETQAGKIGLIADIFFGLFSCGIGKQQIGYEGLKIPLSLSSHILLHNLLGYV